jgi:DNA-binding transcriptional ArsR family regulator
MRTIKDHSAALSLLANSIAYRVLATIGARGPQTTQTLAGVLSDVPASSLYRHLASLRKAGVVCVVAQRQARGAKERTYALASPRAGAFAVRDFNAMPVSRRRAAMRNFLATLVGDTTAYIESRAFARPRPPLNAALVVRALTDAEYLAVTREVSAALSRVKPTRGNRPGRKRRYFYIVTIPEVPAP